MRMKDGTGCPSGVLFLVFGKRVMDCDVVNQIRYFVVLTGGHETAKNTDNVVPERDQLTGVIGFAFQ